MIQTKVKTKFKTKVVKQTELTNLKLKIMDAYRRNEEAVLVKDLENSMGELAIAINLATHDKEAFLAMYGSIVWGRLCGFSAALDKMTATLGEAITRHNNTSK
ncbi:MAG: hypothetical protein SNG27_07635 [Rikenellaceae bacterium]